MRSSTSIGGNAEFVYPARNPRRKAILISPIPRDNYITSSTLSEKTGTELQIQNRRTINASTHQNPATHHIFVPEKKKYSDDGEITDVLVSAAVSTVSVVSLLYNTMQTETIVRRSEASTVINRWRGRGTYQCWC
jgi:hypothetical protein